MCSQLNNNYRFQDQKTEIYETIKKFLLDGLAANPDNRNKGTVELGEVQPALLRKGFLQPQIEATLNEYQQLGIWSISSDGSKIRFIIDN